MKKKVLALLKDNKNEYLSGVKMSELLNVSRTAIWKNINKLRNEGYLIESVSSKGYRLKERNDVFSKEELNLMIENYVLIDEGFYFDTINSTNDYLKKIASDFNHKNMMAVSHNQSKGKGRLGRSFESKNGLFMSYLIRPNLLPTQVSLFTQIAAAAIIKTFKVLTDLEVQIKWPNDIMIGQKKICGILTELNAELNQVNYLVLGIGVNLNQEKFSEELINKATSYKIETNKEMSIKVFLEPFLNFFTTYSEKFLNHGDISEVIEICRNYSMLIGRKVYVINQNKKRMVEVLDLTKSGQLLVINENGEKETIFYGEVSIRGIDQAYI